MLRIVFTGGGTGGHIYPIVAVARALQHISIAKNIDIEMRYLGVAGPYKGTLESYGMRVGAIISTKLRRYVAIQNIIDGIKLPFAILQALAKVFIHMPDVVFSKGGPGALPVVLAARFYLIPVVIHESDSIPGLTNRISAKFAQKVITAFPGAENYLRNKTILLLGNPIREEFLEKDIPQETAKKLFGFNPEKPVILVTGGSQGAVKINDFVLDALPQLVKNFQILHQTGVANFENVAREANVALTNIAPEEKAHYKGVPYFEKDMEDAYLAADVVISRSGSGSIAEIAAFGKPAILIPLPTSVAATQVQNAYDYARSGAAIVIEEVNLQPSLVITQIKKILETPGLKQSMQEKAAQFAKPRAAEQIAEEVLRVA